MAKKTELSSTWTLPNGKQAVSRGDWDCEKCGHQHIAGLGGICVGCPCPETCAPPSPEKPTAPPRSAKEEE